MNFNVVITNQAKADLISIYRYIAHDLQSPQIAEGQLSRLEKAIDSLTQMPERFRVYAHEKWKDRNLRIMPVNNYLVFFHSIKRNQNRDRHANHVRGQRY